MSEKTYRLTAAIALIFGLLVSSDSGIAADWPGWLRGIVLGIAATVTINAAVAAARIRPTVKAGR